MNNKIILIIVFFVLLLPVLNVKAYDINTCKKKDKSTNYRAVLVGIEHYLDSEHDLNTPLEDVDDIEDVLSLGSNNYIIRKITDSQATKQNILNRIDWLESNACEDDVSIFYYSGHGNNQLETNNAAREGYDTSDEYLIPYDFDEDTYGNIYNFIRDDDFADKILNIKGKVIVILDCCKSAGFAEDIKYNANSNHRIAVFSVHSENQIAKEYSTLGNGLLTFHLISGFATNPNDDLTVEDIFSSSNPIYEEAKSIFGISYSQGINLDCIPSTYSIQKEIKDISIIKNFKNQKPEFVGDIKCIKNRRGKVKFEVEFTDKDNDKIDIFVAWKKPGIGGWKYNLNSGQINLEQDYDEQGNYNVAFILRDEHGSISNWKTNNIQIKNGKEKETNILLFEKTPFIKSFLSIYLNKIK